jgi:hypothetical protein
MANFNNFIYSTNNPITILVCVNKSEEKYEYTK